MNTNPKAQPEAFTIKEFCERYSVGRTKAYELFNANEVEARKVGSRTLVTRRSAERWFDSLPIYRIEIE